MTAKEKRNYLRSIGVFIAILVSSHPLSSQNITVKGRTPVNEDDFYYVSVLSAKDSTVLDYRYFDTPGFMMENIRQPEFILQISSPLLYKPYSCKVSNEQNQPVIDVGLIHLEPNVMSLDLVTIVARPPAV